MSRGIRARRIRAIVVASIALLAWLIPAGVASAHANLDRSDPADGQQLNTAPSRVSLTFTETPDPELSSVTVLDAGGSEVQAGPAQPTPGDPKTLVAPLPRDLPDGVYTVSWRMVSEEDGHTTAGALAFGVGVSPATAPRPPTAPTTPGPSPLGVAGKVLLYAGLALLLAAAVVGIGAFGGAVPARRSVLVLSSGTAAIGVVLMTLAESRTVGVGIGDLLGSHTGELYVLLLVAVGTAMVLALVASFIGGRVTLALGGLGAAAVMVVRADGGHAAASTDLPLIQVGLQSLHFAAVGVWIGGLALLALLLHSRKGREAPERVLLPGRNLPCRRHRDRRAAGGERARRARSGAPHLPHVVRDDAGDQGRGRRRPDRARRHEPLPVDPKDEERWWRPAATGPRRRAGRRRHDPWSHGCPHKLPAAARQGRIPATDGAHRHRQ